MAELAAGAVTTLLDVIRNEALLLGRVKGDVQFIKEEMESMNSFLAHLARSEPPGDEHDEQVRTWMNQVRLLAQDCNNCIDLYLFRRNPDVHRARGGLRGYLWWVPWFLHKLVAQHRAAVQMGDLKDRARDVGERRLRYGVEVPAKTAASQSLTAARLTANAVTSSPLVQAAPARGYASGDDEEDGDDQLVATYHSGRRAFYEPPTLATYVKKKLLEWLSEIPACAGETMSIAIVAPDTDPDALAIAKEVLVFSPDHHVGGYDCAVLIDIPAVHPYLLPLQPKEVLFYILRQLKLEHSRSRSREQETYQGEEEELDSWKVYHKQYYIYHEKRRVLSKIKKHIKEMKFYEKLDKIKSEIRVRQFKGHEKKKSMDQPWDQLDLVVLLKRLLQSAATTSQQDQVKNKDILKLPEWDDNIIMKIAKKFKEHMEAEEKGKKLEGQMGGGEAEGGGEEEVERPDGGGEAEEREGGGEAKKEEDNNDDDEKEEEEEEEEESQHVSPIHLHEVQYAHILQQVFPKTRSNKPLQAQQEDKSAAKQATNTTFGEDQIKQMIQEAKQVILATKTTLGEDQIKQMIYEAKQEILRELQEGKNDKNQATGEHGTPDQAIFEEIVEQKMDKMKQEFEDQLEIKGLVDNIKHLLLEKNMRGHEDNYYPLFILKVDETMDVSRWEDTKNALSLLQMSADVLIVTNTKSIQQAKEYCYPRREPIDYSRVGLYYDTVLNLTNNQKNEDNYNPQMFRDILEECAPNEFCMKIFTHALYVNPKRSNEELIKLHKDLQGWPKSFDIVAKKMFKFSYSDLPKEYKSCLLYLAIFSPGDKIRRSTLIGRWVAEGLIFKEDWRSSVRRANRCFQALIDGWLVYPADIGATGKVNSCFVGDLVHGFITKIARKQHIVETRLSRHLARHFSIFNDLQLRSSDKIDIFFEKLSKSSRVSLLKVLDLEGCQCFGGKIQRYLKDICTKMLLLKYLSLRGTDITHLPSKINQLRELEVLDIRQTKVPTNATANVLLLKLKRLLAGHIDPSPNNSETTQKLVSSVQIPQKIDKMVNMEVLSNVEARSSKDWIDIGSLCHLRKLGVIIDDKTSHLKNLLQSISNLHECLCSLSITLPVATKEVAPSHECLCSLSITRPVATREVAPSSEDLPLEHPPKLLESLSIRGTTQNVHLLPLFNKDGTSLNKLVKVTLSSTLLNQDNLEVLAELPKLRCVRLRHITCAESMLTFKNSKFNSLKILLIEGTNFTGIIFEDRAAPELEKMVLSFTNIGSVSGVISLKRLEELELNNYSSRLLSSFKNAKQIAKLTLRGTLLEQGEVSQITFSKDEFKRLEELELNNNSSRLLSSFKNAKQIAKLTLRGTLLEQGEVSQITFSKDEFPKLNNLIVHCPAITDIVFNNGSAPKLEKIVWSSTSLSGIKNLPGLKELEFNGELVPDKVKEDIKEHKNRPVLKHSK